MLLKDFVIMAQKQFRKDAIVTRSDNGLESKLRPMKEFYVNNDIIHQTNRVDAP